MSWDYPNYCMVEIGQNTEKSPGDVKRLAVIQTPVKKPSANAGVKNSRMSKIMIWSLVFQENYLKHKFKGIFNSVSNSVLSVIEYIVSKVGDRNRGQPKGSLFNSYYTEMYGKAPLRSLDCSTLPLIRTLYCWALNKEISSAIFKVFAMTRPGIEPRSPEWLANTLPTSQWAELLVIHSYNY